MRRAILILAVLATALWSAPSFAQSRNQPGPLCTPETMPAGQRADACNKINALGELAGAKLALGDLDGALADINEAIRIDPSLPQPLTNRAVIWRAKGNLDRAIADATEAIRLAKAKAPANVMTPPGSVLISAHIHRALAYEAKGDFDRAKLDYAATLQGQASDAGSKANQATAKVRLSLLSETLPPAPRTATTVTPHQAGKAAPPPPASAAAPAKPAGAASPSQPAPAEAMRKRADTEKAETEKVAVRRVALVIGNSAYARVRPLPNPTNDARAMAKSLREIGFVVTEGTDLDRAAMQATIRDFLRDAARSQVAVVYYAGHGVQVDGRNYLVPVDIQFQGSGGLTDTMMDLDTIMAGLDDQVRTNILILDACRNNPMAPRVASTGPTRDIEAGSSGLAAPTTLGNGSTFGAGTLIAFATAPGQVALDGEGSNSPFSAALTRHIGTPGLEVQQMLTRVRAEVVAATKGKQVPWSNSSLLGEVYLADR
jgi:tetratricopeptide (TPR) repeat protein